MTTCITPELDVLLNDIMKIVGNNTPKNVFKYLLNVTQIPRGSNKTQDDLSNSTKIINTLTEWGKNLGCDVYIDKGKNIIIRKPGSKGYENKLGVCIQCHMDMVTEAEEGYNIDFLNDPIKPYIENNEYLRAYKTSLGADDGVGIGACFSVLEDKTLIHPPLEILITRDEETGLYGASALESNILKSKYFINVDSEGWKSVCIGCAGGFTYNVKHGIIKESNNINLTKKIILRDCKGGHSGVNINLGRINPIIMMGRLLCCAKNTQFKICNITGGSAHNAIPRDCTSIISIEPSQWDNFINIFNNEFNNIKNEYIKIDPNISYEIIDMNSIPYMNSVESLKLMNYLNSITFGPIRWSPDVNGLVDTSHNIGVININDTQIEIIGSCRGFAQSQLDWMYTWLLSYTQLTGYILSERIGAYPGWKPDPENILNKIIIEETKKAYNCEPEVYAVHAGLECGIFMGKYPDIMCTSIGPEINYPHSPNERLLLKSVEGFYNSLINTLNRLTQI